MTAQVSAALSQNHHTPAQPRRYSSFSSLKWEHITATRLRWHDYWVWAVGASPKGVGGVWFTSHHPHGFTSQEAAQAAIEILHLESEPPALEDAHLVCTMLAKGPLAFDRLKDLTGLDEDELSDAIAEARSHNAIRSESGSWKLFDARLLPSPPLPKEILVNTIPNIAPAVDVVSPVTSFADYAAKQLTQIDEDIERLTKRRAALQTTLEGVRLLQELDTPVAAELPKPALQANSFTGMELVRATIKFLSILGVPQTLREVHKGLVDGGWHTQAVDPIDNMRRMLQRHRERSDTMLTFVDNRWGLKEWPN